MFLLFFDFNYPEGDWSEFYDRMLSHREIYLRFPSGLVFEENFSEILQK